MRKILNPYATGMRSNCKCFGCSPHNEFGLNMEFYEKDGEVISYWRPKEHFEGYDNVLHGGIQGTMLDEIASWVVNTQCKTGGVTAQMDVRFRKPVFMNGGELTIKARLKEHNSRMATIQAEVYNADGDICSEAEVKYMIFPEKIAREKFGYPGIEHFFE